MTQDAIESVPIIVPIYRQVRSTQCTTCGENVTLTAIDEGNVTAQFTCNCTPRKVVIDIQTYYTQ